MAQIQQPDTVWTSLRRAPDDDRPPAPLVLGIAFALLLGWAGLAAVLDLPTTVAVLGAVVVVATASWWLTIVTGRSSLSGIVAARSGPQGARQVAPGFFSQAQFFMPTVAVMPKPTRSAEVT